MKNWIPMLPNCVKSTLIYRSLSNPSFPYCPRLSLNRKTIFYFLYLSTLMSPRCIAHSFCTFNASTWFANSLYHHQQAHQSASERLEAREKVLIKLNAHQFIIPFKFASLLTWFMWKVLLIKWLWKVLLGFVQITNGKWSEKCGKSFEFETIDKHQRIVLNVSFQIHFLCKSRLKSFNFFQKN